MDKAGILEWPSKRIKLKNVRLVRLRCYQPCDKFDHVWNTLTVQKKPAPMWEREKGNYWHFWEEFGVSGRDDPSMAQTDLGMGKSMCWQCLRMFVINGTWEGIQHSCGVPSRGLIFSAKRIGARSRRCNKHNLSLSLFLCFPAVSLRLSLPLMAKKTAHFCGAQQIKFTVVNRVSLCY